jgi:DNA-binding FadR family transcriptional regulator
MKNDEKTKKSSKYRPTPISVRFNEEEFKAVSIYAQSRDKKLGTLVRESCLAYLQNFSEHEELFKNIKTEDPMKAEQTIFDVLNKHTDTLDKTLKKLEE